MPAGDAVVCTALMQTMVRVAARCGAEWEAHVRDHGEPLSDVLTQITATATVDIADDDTDDGAHTMLLLGQTLQHALLQ